MLINCYLSLFITQSLLLILNNHFEIFIFIYLKILCKYLLPIILGEESILKLYLLFKNEILNALCNFNYKNIVALFFHSEILIFNQKKINR